MEQSACSSVAWPFNQDLSTHPLHQTIAMALQIVCEYTGAC